MDEKLNNIIEKRFDSESERWNSIHKNVINTIIDWEVYKRKEITIRYLKNNYYKVNNLKILEIGCGAGNNLFEISQINKNWNCVGVDISKNMIDYCKKTYNNKSKLKFKVLNIEKNILNEEFDIIILLGVVGYFNSNEKAFDNIFKMLNREGVLIFTYGNKFSTFRYIRNVYLNWTKYKFTRSIGNFIRINMLKRREYLNHNPEKLIFNATSYNELVNLFPSNLMLDRKINLCFSSGILGRFSVKLNSKIEKYFYDKDFLNQSLTKLLIFKFIDK